MNASWHNVAADFEPDGALRDIYVQNATLADWQIALDLIRRGYAPVTFTRDGVEGALPPSAADAFADRADAALSLKFEVGGIELACYFFTPTEIEFDLPPAQVNSEERFGALQDFLRALATTLRKPVVLSFESSPELAILTLDPAGRVTYHPA